ncbi:acyltransferase family protein [Chitinophaga arvensicola]|nr:heparan-alpha-glucosaminide N-acetyltransferase domain-containing protein [Chitinophaga arvensicola]
MNKTTIANPARYLSLDVLRGLTIALMIVVNSPGSWNAVYAPLAHSPWHGFTLTDLVFPTFLFVVGNALAFSMKRYEGPGQQQAFLLKVFKRTIIIFLIGLLLNQFPFIVFREGRWIAKPWDSVRIFGVLQRIAICYCIASLMIFYFSKRMNLILSGVILLGYWACLYYGGDPADPYGLAGNAALKFDLLLFSPKNLYHGFGQPFEPEAVLSNFPAVVNVLAGYFAGKALLENKPGTVKYLMITGASAVLIACLWHLIFPINKPLWTSSYVLLTVGLDLLLLAFLVLVIDQWKADKWTKFFVVFGKNALFIYILAWTIGSMSNFVRVEGMSLSRFNYEVIFSSWLNPYNASLLYAVTYMLFIWVLAYIMDQKRIYIKV